MGFETPARQAERARTVRYAGAGASQVRVPCLSPLLRLAEELRERHLRGEESGVQGVRCRGDGMMVCAEA